MSRKDLQVGQLSKGHQAILSLQRGHSRHHRISENRANLTDALHLWIKREISLTSSEPKPIALCCCTLTRRQWRHEMQRLSQTFSLSIQLRISQSWPLGRSDCNRDESKSGYGSSFRATSTSQSIAGWKRIFGNTYLRDYSLSLGAKGGVCLRASSQPAPLFSARNKKEGPRDLLPLWTSPAGPWSSPWRQLSWQKGLSLGNKATSGSVKSDK